MIIDAVQGVPRDRQKRPEMPRHGRGHWFKSSIAHPNRTLDIAGFVSDAKGSRAFPGSAPNAGETWQHMLNTAPDVHYLWTPEAGQSSRTTMHINE
jgi:hypothetical protein